MHEMPDLFKIGDWWHHIVTEYSDRSKKEIEPDSNLTNKLGAVIRCRLM